MYVTTEASTVQWYGKYITAW